MGTGVLTSVGVKTGWTMETSLLLFFLAKNHKMAKLPKISGENFLFFFLKKNSPNSSLFWGSMSSPVSQSVCLSTGHNFNDPVQKVSPVKAKSVWICLGILASVATAQKGKNHRLLASIPRQIESDFARLATLFQGTLKIEASRHKCGDSRPPSLPRPKKTHLLSLLRNLKWKISFCFFPFIAFW